MENVESNKKEQCPEIPFFGANYPDARCIDGSLYDLDSYEDNGFTIGGEVPCPFCNTEAHIEYFIDTEAGITRDFILEEIEKLRQKYS